MWNITMCISIYFSVHTHCYCYKILALWPYVLECTHAQSNNQRAYPKQQKVKLSFVSFQTEYWETITNTFYLHKQSTSQRQLSHRNSANHQVILLSCDFLFFPSLHQEFGGQEDLSAVTERIMGVGIPLAVITALIQHPVLSLPLFSHPLSFCLFSLLSSDRLRSN